MKYRDYVIFIKAGIFYECIANDALIINCLFNYKAKVIGNTIKVGFPVKNIESILEKLKENSINYIVVDDDKVNKKFEIDENKYCEYKVDIDSVLYNILRIEKIIKYLNDNTMNSDLTKKIDKIERLLDL